MTPLIVVVSSGADSIDACSSIPSSVLRSFAKSLSKTASKSALLVAAGMAQTYDNGPRREMT